MAGISRANIAAVLWSALCNAILLGGTIWGLGFFPQTRVIGTASTPLVMELLPLADEQRSRRAQAPSERTTLPVESSMAALPAKRPAIAAPVPLVEAAAERAGSVATLTFEADNAESASSIADPSALSDYRRVLNEAIGRQTRYPADALKLRLAGVTQLGFSLDRSGRVLGSWIERSSGSTRLDSAALEALARAQPLPAIPTNLPARLDFIIEIDAAAMS